MNKLGLIGGGVALIVLLIMCAYTVITEMISASDTMTNIMGFTFLIVLVVICYLVILKIIEVIIKTIKTIKTIKQLKEKKDEND